MAESFEQNIAAWQAKVDARIFAAPEFLEFKTIHNLHLVGLMGFVGSWPGWLNLRRFKIIANARQALVNQLEPRQRRFSNRLVLCSGATNAGVLKLAYQEADRLGIAAMGITPDSALNYNVAKMDYLLPVGADFGDESEVFLNVSDEFILLGGGQQSRTETLAAAQRSKPITVIQGFGGAADDFSPQVLPQAQFVNGRTPAW